MSIQHTDTDKHQETPPRNSASRYTEDTVQSEKVSPAASFLQPLRRPSHTRRDRLFVIAAVLIALALILSVGAIVISQHPAAQITPTPTAPATTLTPTPGGSDTTPTPVPGVVWGPQSGPSGVSDPTYWDRILATQGTNGKVEYVYFANVMGNPSLQALVTVRHSNVNRTLDVHVFDKITNTKPTQIFRLQGLVNGDAKISGYNTILTAEVDQNSTINAGKSSAQWTQDIFREFEWNGSKGTLVQVAFPGMDVISILRKKRQQVTGYEVHVKGVRAEENPMVFVDITVEHVVTGHHIQPEAVVRAIELSEGRYCGAGAMLGKVAHLTHVYRIVEAEETLLSPSVSS